MVTTKNTTEEIYMLMNYVCSIASAVSYASVGTGGYIYVINVPIVSQFLGLIPRANSFVCYKVNLGHIEAYRSNDTLDGRSFNADINNKEDLYNFLSSFANIDANSFKELLIEITKEQFFDKEWLINKAEELQ